SQEWILQSRWCTNRRYTVESGLTAEQARWLAGFDFTPGSTKDMLLICQRLDRAVRAGELEEIAAWYGNVDGDQRVDGWDNIRNVVATSDSSHLWHLHITFKRRHANDMALMRRVFAVLTGTNNGGLMSELSGAEQRELYNAICGKGGVRFQVAGRGPKGDRGVVDYVLEGKDAVLERLNELPAATAEATLARLGQVPVAESARVLVAVLGSERARELGAALTAGPGSE
ncbi:hypothetical protein, partial [Polymorphospora rubra]